MQGLGIFALNEVMAFITLVIVFPGFLPPKDKWEAVMCFLMFIPLSFIWWLFLALFPFVYFILRWSGGLESPNPYFHEWPFR